MSGIAGIWNLDGRPVEKVTLEGMSATLAHRGGDGEGLWIDGPVGLACQLFRVTPEAQQETQPLLHPSGAVIVFDGRLDNRHELLALLKASPGIATDSPDPAMVLAANAALGDGFPERLSGDFALALFDPGRQKLVLARDAVGLRPLYYCRAGHAFLFASEIRALLTHPDVSARPDDDVLAQFLLTGPHQSPQGGTVFREISSLPPAHLVVFTPHGFSTRRYWDFDFTRRIGLRSLEEYAEAFREHFERAVARRLRSAHPVAVFVSGGLDSASVLCVAEALRLQSPDLRPPLLGISLTSANGLPSGESDERAFLSEIEQHWALEIERCPLLTAGFVDECAEAVSHVEAPFLDTQWYITHRFLHLARDRGARVVLTGDWAEQMLMGQAYLVDLFRCFAWSEVSRHLKEFALWSKDTEPRVFRQQFLLDLLRFHLPSAVVPLARRLRARLGGRPSGGPRYAPALLRRARASIDVSPHAGGHASAHAQSVYRYVRSDYKVLFLEGTNKLAAARGVEVAFPFLDRDLIAFLMAVPGEIQTWRGVPKALLRHAMRGILPDALVRRTWQTDSTEFVDEGMVRDFPELARFLDPAGMAVRLGYIAADVMLEERGRAERWIAGRGVVPSSARELAALELWLRIFFDAPSAKPPAPASGTRIGGGA